MRRGKIDTMWSSDINIGAHDLTCWLSLTRFRQIKKHICFNTWHTDRIHKSANHPYRKFTPGLTYLCTQSRKLFKEVDIYTIDELRIRSSSKRNKYKTFQPQKPIRNGTDVYTLSCASKTHSGLVFATVPYCGKKTYVNEEKLDDDE